MDVERLGEQRGQAGVDRVTSLFGVRRGRQGHDRPIRSDRAFSGPLTRPVRSSVSLAAR